MKKIPWCITVTTLMANVLLLYVNIKQKLTFKEIINEMIGIREDDESKYL